MYRIMNVRNFRTAFPTLTEPVMVVSREKVIGVWRPPGTEEAPHVEAVEGLIADLKTRASVEPAVSAKSQQAERDAILKRVNRGG